MIASTSPRRPLWLLIAGAVLVLVVALSEPLVDFLLVERPARIVVENFKIDVDPRWREGGVYAVPLVRRQGWNFHPEGPGFHFIKVISVDPEKACALVYEREIPERPMTLEDRGMQMFRLPVDLLRAHLPMPHQLDASFVGLEDVTADERRWCDDASTSQLSEALTASLAQGCGPDATLPGLVLATNGGRPVLAPDFELVLARQWSWGGAHPDYEVTLLRDGTARVKAWRGAPPAHPSRISPGDLDAIVSALCRSRFFEKPGSPCQAWATHATFTSLSVTMGGRTHVVSHACLLDAPLDLEVIARLIDDAVGMEPPEPRHGG